MKITPTRQAETELWQAGHRYVVGIDEVGRGALAGPVTAAAVILPEDCDLPMVADSKLLTHEERHKAAEAIKRTALAIGVGWVANGELDKSGLTWAVTTSGKRALASLGNGIDAVLLDGNHNYLSGAYSSRAIVGADGSCLCVAAASIIAKVARDSYMELLHRTYHLYGFAGHKGYGTKFHRAALAQYGPSPLHRYSYQPVRELSLVG
ncbi:MAG TPA: ribonuclease HII [Candidatus Dormibacteraeota bacterium]|nr:ribonuclease HII [Candidatus Dormibacteraeota bacterium]